MSKVFETIIVIILTIIVVALVMAFEALIVWSIISLLLWAFPFGIKCTYMQAFAGTVAFDFLLMVLRENFAKK